MSIVFFESFGYVQLGDTIAFLLLIVHGAHEFSFA